MSRVQKAEYALYRGDEFIIVGTIKEIAEYQHTTEKTIRFYSSPTYKKRAKNAYALVRVDDE